MHLETSSSLIFKSITARPTTTNYEKVSPKSILATKQNNKVNSGNNFVNQTEYYKNEK